MSCLDISLWWVLHVSCWIDYYSLTGSCWTYWKGWSKGLSHYMFVNIHYWHFCVFIYSPYALWRCRETRVSPGREESRETPGPPVHSDPRGKMWEIISLLLFNLLILISRSFICPGTCQLNHQWRILQERGGARTYIYKYIQGKGLHKQEVECVCLCAFVNMK